MERKKVYRNAVSVLCLFLVSFFLHSCANLEIAGISEHDEMLLETYFSEEEQFEIRSSLSSVEYVGRYVYGKTSYKRNGKTEITVYEGEIHKGFGHMNQKYIHSEETFHDVVLLHEFCHILCSPSHGSEWVESFDRRIYSYCSANGLCYGYFYNQFIASYAVSGGEKSYYLKLKEES